MGFQYAKRCRWLLWLRGALVLSSLASTKAASSFRHASEDHLNRQLSVNNTPVLDFSSINEERALPLSPEALALYDELVGTSMNYKAWMNKLGFPIEKGAILDQKAFDTVFPVLLHKHTESQLLQLFHDPTGAFLDVTVEGKTLGLRLLQHWKGEGVSDAVIMQRMMQGDSNHRNMLTDDSMLRTWISFSDGRQLGVISYYTMLIILDGMRKDVLRFYFVVSENSGNSNVKKVASDLLIVMFEDLYLEKLDRENIVNSLLITDDEVKKMEAVLRRYSDFVASRSADKIELEKIVKAETGDKAQAKLLESRLYDKWLSEQWYPIDNFWDLEGEEYEVLNRLRDRLVVTLQDSP